MGSYNLGLSQLAQWGWGIAVGWTVLSFFVIVPMSRRGFLPRRVAGVSLRPAARLLAVLINVQSRTNVLGNIFFSMFLVLNIIAGIEETTCWLVVGRALSSVLYIVRGGLRAGVLTDALQSATMIVASFVLWGFVYSGLGGWDGVTARLEAGGRRAVGYAVARGWLFAARCASLHSDLRLLGGIDYVRGHQSVRGHPLPRRAPEWDFKMAALVASIATAICLFFNVSLGPMAGRNSPVWKSSIRPIR